ncbi:hypothetical protein H112_03683 [Trichophyton rubrum D6]|uniref:Folliculin-interacting protein N-terminal domain-containing protein n=4 Tax=Trichophyton TaxID=5550 RepID=A0A178EY07_TRIRU|nr:uncharacterized protein TERG_05010 [Trichophyton rubrum CBS 118892]EZF23709.1 hypothetical protein H100_03691 [Trichophyton rubrum MR850]EZF42773.1 hypothetical protein H102_03682 [Trichophyton rubrum CBS 100081]EZF53413.1 hypothetical protein H103_03695 [Trichophyton rubrum CBS 288.86]EZF64039.1 hypothetical protein H104_03679 [Trichophyton rubrum CBS 289.86]EZF74639.1 hypothetical protein H105_03706 [Trichophyton soudanense CBS 452.61]EZF85310.1 hypothetical protein H110_03692 [Trichophy
MLGRLLNTAAATLNPASYANRNSNQLESVTEEEHTSGLLFPDVSLLQRSRTHAYPLQTSSVSPSPFSAGSFDDNGGLELDSTKDLRVIIAQNAIGDRDDPCILLDTQAPLKTEKSTRPSLDRISPEKPRSRHTRNSTLPRNDGRPSHHASRASVSDLPPLSSFSNQDATANSAFFRARNRRSTFSDSAGDDDQQHGRLSGDSNELGLLNCIFGSSAFSYRGPSTKMHIVPADEKKPADDSKPALSDPYRRTLRRADTFSGSPRSASQTRERFSSDAARSSSASSSSSVTVLVTRMFSVNLPESYGMPADTPMPNSATPSSPYAPEFKFSPRAKSKKIKEKKTPMYAVAITVRLPVTAKNSVRQQRNSYLQDPAKPCGGMSVSLDSHPKWSLFDEASISTTGSSIDDRIDLLVDYWDVIARTLSRLEKLASKEILELLKQTVQQTTNLPKPAKGPNMQRTNQTIVQLIPNCLAQNILLRDEALHATSRVCMALRIPPVVSGQSRWGVWREEARWIARSLSEKEHNFFFLVLITAFLGNHTEWLSLLGPDWYRRRHFLQQRAQQDSELSICNRTVIISTDKMAARRLIFVLSAFLPPQQRTDPLASPLRPSTSTSFRQTSQSPPNPTIIRQESLRRTINRRARTRQFPHERGAGKRSASVSSNETSNIVPDEPEFSKSPINQARRGSDARSMRTSSLSIPPGGVAGPMKSGTASAAMAAPGTATPVPHFASQPRKQYRARHESQDCKGSASANLLLNLQKSEISANVDQHQSKWGNILSGFWNNRDDAPANGGASRARRASTQVIETKRQPPAVSAKVKENGSATLDSVSAMTSDTISIPTSPPAQTDSKEDVSTLETRQPTSPVKLCVKPGEGIVDVEVPLPGFMSLSSSNDSTLTSPKKTRTSITSIDCDGSFHSTSPWSYNNYKDWDGPSVNVAGWLKYYHEDFALQAVHPYPDLESSIKRSMSAERTPNLANFGQPSYFDGGSERWVDVCSTLVADTRTFTVKRIRLRRKIATVDDRTTEYSHTPSPQFSYQPFGTQADSSDTTPTSTLRKSQPCIVEEEFVEEPVMDLDATLVDAVERVLACSGPTSAIHSRAPSPSRLRRGRMSVLPTEDSRRCNDTNNRPDVPSVEIPRNECRRMVLGALDEVVRSVAAEHRQDESNVGPDTHAGFSKYNHKKLSGITDNTLREGIRKWLQDIDECC